MASPHAGVTDFNSAVFVTTTVAVECPAAWTAAKSTSASTWPVSTHSPFATLGVKPSPAMSTVSIPTWTSTSASSSVRMP